MTGLVKQQFRHLLASGHLYLLSAHIVEANRFLLFPVCGDVSLSYTPPYPLSSVITINNPYPI
ncbi:hypothetical protein KIS4809_4738 [Bacillus sp. ZZV12-4809]|nr:hypothetical protein KIS4809_4738 [Bacillus sp. ZZV12-4809]